MPDSTRLSVLALDHVNLRTARLAELVSFYTSVLGLTPGPRPAFGFPGAWLYCGDRAVVHLVEVAPSEMAPHTGSGEPNLSHFAFRATGLDALLGRLRAAGVAYQVAAVPDARVTQIHLRDPDGNSLHVDFG